MSSGLSTDTVAPKNASRILLDCRTASVPSITIQPNTQTISAPISIGSLADIATQTGSITFEGGICHLRLDSVSIPSDAYAGAVATCPLLIDTPAVPSAEKAVLYVCDQNYVGSLGVLRLSPSGTITYCTTVNGAGWASSQPGNIFSTTLHYKI